MAKKDCNKFCFLLFKGFIYVASFGVFLIQIKRILDDYFNGLSTIGSSTHNHDQLHLPAITFCPGVAFKNKGPFYNENDFVANAYDLSDIFLEKTVKKIKNSHQYEVKEVRNVLQGRCYTISILGMYRPSHIVLPAQ